MKEEHKVICMDLDGVLAQYNGWKGMATIGKPIPGAYDFCKQMIKDGWRIIVHTCRPGQYVESWLREWEFPEEIEVESNMNDGAWKPIAAIYIDDRGIRFKGNFKMLIEEIKIFKPWWMK